MECDRVCRVLCGCETDIESDTECVRCCVGVKQAYSM